MIRCLKDKDFKNASILIDKLKCGELLHKEISNRLVYGLFIKNILIGVYRLKKYKKYLQLDSIYIKQPFRKYGYGKKLLRHAEYMARKMGYKLLRVWTNTDYGKVYIFYSKCGYIFKRFYNKCEFLFEKRLLTNSKIKKG